MIALVIENRLDSTGVGRYTRYLIEVLDRNGSDYNILDCTKTISHRRVRHIPYWYRKVLYLLVWCGIRDVFPTVKYDVLVFPTASPLSVLFRGNKIVAVHDLMHKFYNFPEVSNYLIRSYRESLYKSLANAKVTVVMDSQVGVKHWRKFYGKNNKELVIPFYANLNKACSTVSRIINENDLDNYLFYPAAFWAHKNHVNLVKAIEYLVAESNRQFKVVFCGKPNAALDEIKDLIVELNLDDRFTIFDFVSDNELIELYHNSKGLVFPSYFGPTNIPPLEAISLGVPMAVADVFEPKSIYGEGILVFDPDNVQEIAKACSLLLNTDKVYVGDINKREEKFVQYWLRALNEN
jgi:glycosyltransferase involved in cell wall biosynthesis